MVDAGRLYKTCEHSGGSHLALSWKGRVRFTVPKEAAAQRQTWNLFKPGKLEIILRAQATLPRLMGALRCVESKHLELIRETIGHESGLSSCRAGAPGPWYKDTVLLLDRAGKPLYIVKAGAGEAVNSLLKNEAEWLKTLRDDPVLAGHIPECIAHRSAADLCFVAERPIEGEYDSQLSSAHIDFLHKLQAHNSERIRLEESRYFRTLRLRMDRLKGLLSAEWSERFDSCVRFVGGSLSGAPVLVVAAHNDFTPWNIRVSNGVARVFDWEYADHGQLPLFDPLHFFLMPMLLGDTSIELVMRRIEEAVEFCILHFGKETCYEPKAQAAAYLLNLSSLYLSSIEGNYGRHHVLDRCAALLDSICRRQT